MYRCNKCNFDVPIDKKDIHNEYCKNLPSLQELNNFIPCELCNESIEINKYNRHLSACIKVDKFYTYLKNPYLLGNLIVNSSQNSNNVNNTETDNIDEHNNNESSIGLNIQIGSSITYFPLSYILKLLNPDLDNDSNNTLISDMIEIIQNESTYDEYQSNINLAEEIGKVEIGVKDIDLVTKVVDYNVDGKECPICKELLSSYSIIRETTCKHLYCNDCIQKWLKKNKSCPICNKEF